MLHVFLLIKLTDSVKKKWIITWIMNNGEKIPIITLSPEITILHVVLFVSMILQAHRNLMFFKLCYAA